MRWTLLLALLLGGCGGSSSVAWAGRWREPFSSPGTFVVVTLSGSGTSITGSGVQHREAGADLTFTVEGTAAPMPGPSVTFHYSSGDTEGFQFSQPDTNHLLLQNAQRTLNLVRQ